VLLSEFRTAVNTQVGLSLSTAATTQIINQALRQVADEHDWPWLDLEETGTWPAAEFITLEAAAKAVRSVKVGNLRYDPMAEQDADLDWSERIIKGYSVAGRQLRVAPTPPTGEAYTIWYVAYENLLTADADEALIPDAHADAVVQLACSMAHDRPEGNDKARDRFGDRYLAKLGAMLRTSQPKRGAQLVRTRQDVP
jgi:hypothetical protein